MNTILQILLNIADTARRFQFSFQNELELEALLFRYGWLADLDSVIHFKDLSEALVNLGDKIAAIEAKEENEETAQEEIEALENFQELASIVKEVQRAILAIKGLQASNSNFPSPLDQSEFWEEFSARIIEDLFTLTLQRHYPIAYGFLHFFGIIEYIEETPVGEQRVNYTRTNIDWGRFVELISNPVGLVKEVYSWNVGGQEFDWEKLLRTLERTFLSNRFLVRYILPRRSIVEGFTPAADFADYEEYVFAQGLQELQIPFIYGASILDDLFYNIGLGIMPVGRKSDNGQFDKAPEGIMFIPILQGDLSHGFFITPEISLQLGSTLNADSAVAVKLFPDDIEFPLALPDAGVSAHLIGSPYTPWIILGAFDSHRLELHGFDIGMSVQNDGDEPEIKLSFKATSPDPAKRGLKAVIDLGGSDAFIRGTAKSDSNNIEAGFDLEIEWSSIHGIRFGGNAELEFQTHLNQKFGFLEVTNFYLSILAKSTAGQNVVRLRVGLGLKGTLGPVQFFIENTGFALDTIPYQADEVDSDNPPALGLMDFDLSYAPPKEIGLIVDTESVKGGGYLIFEPDNHRYVGLAELSVRDQFTVKAVAIINTQLPDGQDGYSFLLLITAEFKPIQLPFGFTLEGVGGLIGIHRSMHMAAIREKVKGDDFDRVLFPEDPINNVHSIIASLDSIFPIQEGQYSFGIMGKIGWGTPKLIDIKAGLIFQVPRFKMAIIGTAKSEIVRTSKSEDGEEPEAIVLLRIQISFAAWVEPKKSLLRFDASLFKSEILGKKLTGDAALRLRGGDDPYFMITVGGCHHDFEPPKGLGLEKLNRIEIAFKPESIDLDITAQFYVALTSNTLQVGAELTAAYDGPGITIEGGIGFDALFQFRPIYFKVDAWGYVTVHAWGFSGGVKVKGSIEGPYPFSFSLYVTVSFGPGSKDFRIPTFTIGRKAREERPTIDVLKELREVIEDDRSWSPVLLDRTEVLVSLRDRRKEFTGEEDTEAELIVHPFGGLKIDQDRVPLGVILQRFGHHQPEGYNFFSLTIPGEEEKTEHLEGFFAPAQFFEMKREEQLTRPSFEKMNSGLQIRDFQELQTGSRILAKEVRYETEYHDPYSTRQAATPPPPTRIAPGDFAAWRANAAIARSALGKKNKRPARPNAVTLNTERIAEDEFAVIHQDGAADFPEIKTKSETVAQQTLEKLILEQPELGDKLVVVPIYEIA